MRLKVSAFTNKPKVDIFGGASGIFAGNIPRLDEFFDPSDFDAWICPHDLFDTWKDEDYISYLNRLAEEKTVFLFNRGDFARHFCHPNVISLQTSIEPGFRCTKHRTIIVPYNVKMLTPFASREYLPKPVISFMGYVPKVTPGRIFRSFWPFPPKLIQRNGALIRRVGLSQIARFPNSKVTSRTEYSGTHKAHSRDKNLRRLYEESIIDSDLVFCPRGDGNMSQRFYEAIASGRVPIVPNSTMLFPKFEGETLSKSIIELDSLSINLRSSVMKFWNRLNEESYHELQKKLETTFREHLSYEKYILKLFKSRLEDIEKFVF